MQYVLLIYDDEAAWDALDDTGVEAMMKAYREFTQRLNARGVMRGGEALRSVATATSVRGSGGDSIVTDGPFVETKEQLGGFYLVECASLDEAIELAGQVPVAGSGGVEVRPIMETKGGPG